MKQADCKELAFQKLTKNKLLGEYEKEQLKKGAIENYASIKLSKEALKSEGVKYSAFRPVKYLVKTDEDIFTIEGDIIVNEYVKKALEKILPNHALFESAQQLNIKIPQEIYDAKRNNDISRDGLIVNSGIAISETFTFYSKKAIRLEATDKPFATPIVADEFRQVQIKLNIIIPDSFKSKYRKRQLDTEEYEFIPIEKFYTQNEYAARVPETFKSVIVAENGCGDALGLLLRKEDDYKLRDELFEFNHETGVVELYG